MRDILKKIFTNVEVKDDEEKFLLVQSNLFVRTGRAIIRDVLAGVYSIDNSKYVVEFGSGLLVPAEGDIDITPFAPAIYTPNATNTTYTTNIIDATEIDFIFTYTNSTGSSVTFSELGLFYRPLGPSPDSTPADRVNVGILMARLKTTFTTITIGAGRNITITWKIIF